MSHTLLRTLDLDFIRFEVLSGLGVTILTTREGDLDSVLILQSDSVFALFTDERGVVLSRNLQDLRSFIRLCKGIR